MAGAPHATRLPDAARVDHTWLTRLQDRVRALTPDALRTDDAEFDRSITERSRKTWFFDVLAAVFTVAFTVAVHIDRVTDGADGSNLMLIVDLVCVPVAIVLLFWRRRWPFAIAAALAVIGSFAPGTGFAAIVATYALGAYARPNLAMVGIGLLLVSVPIVTMLWPDAAGNDGSMWSDLIFGVLVTLGVGAWGLFTGARRQLMWSLQDRATRAESEQALRVDQARAQERTRIAREMHDVLAHRMSLLSVHAGALEFRPDAPPEDVARAAGVIRATAHEALEELRTVIGVMRVGESLVNGAAVNDDDAHPLAPEPPQPTLSSVPHLVEEWRAAGARIELHLDQDAVAALPPTVGRTAYRIVQEALTNAGKHAPTARVDVRVSGTPGDSLVVSVANPLGVGLHGRAEIPGTGLGLVGLRERTELVGGAFAAGVDEDLRRFVLEARLPWPATP